MSGASPGHADAASLASLSPPDRLVALASSNEGLLEAEAAQRLVELGPNDPVAATRRHPTFAFFAQFTHTLALLLWFAAGLSFAAGLPTLGGAILAVIIVNGLFAFLQEHRAEQVVASLMKRVAVQARAVRGGGERQIPAAALVPGDLVRLAAGDVVPADCVLLTTGNLTLDLSMLTGESVPVERTSDVVADRTSATRTHDLACIAPAGSAVITGTADAVVYATGPRSTLGEISALVQGVHRGSSALEREVADLSRLTAIVAVLAGTATLSLLAFATDTTILTALTFATGVIVALVPEGLLPTLSVALAAGAKRMAVRGAAVRRLSAVEIVGSVTTICTDKTGTLTENALSIRGFVGPDGASEPTHDALLAAALCNDAHQNGEHVEGDPIDALLLQWVLANDEDHAVLRERYPRVEAVPFDAHRRYMTATCRCNGTLQTFAKGAPEALVDLIDGESIPRPIAEAIEAATGQGERVLLLAGGPPGQPLSAIGLVRFHDPPRPEVPAAIAACKRAGVRIVMLTGDHPATARSVATSVGLAVDDASVLHGEAIDAMGDDALLEAIGKSGNALVARADPHQKLRIVSLLRRSGEVVVVTGDGINDAPALRAADVGVAMGRRGTEVAKQAADVVLADDNFATIVAAIEEGRSIKTNIRRFVSYVLTSNVAELAPFLVYVFLPVPLPLAVIQVLAIDLGTDLLPALALGLEPPSHESMGRPPEPPGRPLLTRNLALTTFLFFGMIEAVLGLCAWIGRYWVEGWRPFGSLAPYQAVDREAATLAFLGIVAGQIGCLFAQRDGSLHKRLSLNGNRWIVWGLLFEIGLALVLVYVPGLNRIFSMTAVSPLWLLVLPFGAGLFLALDVIRRRLCGRRGTDDV
ncbi:MAG TPA: cation-transporting P-type ATPase [Thermomicrobiales bacterium]